MIRKRPDGTIEWVVDSVYDEQGDIIRKTMRNPDGNAVAFLSYQYEKDQFGNWTSRKELMSVYGVWQWPKEIVHRELKY
jgi:predicted transcriptional regulator